MNIVKQSFSEFIKNQKCVTALEYALEILPKCSVAGPWIAGGALLRTYTGQPLDSDIDVFFQTKEQYEAYVMDLTLRSYKGLSEVRKSSDFLVKETIVSEWHTTLTVDYMDRTWKIQCVTFVYFKDISELFGSFDFDVCMWAYDGQTVHAFESTIESVKTKKISLKKINYPSVTLKRLVKYMRQGYDVNDTDVLALSRSFRSTKKEPKGIMDEHFGMNGGSKSGGDDYKSLKNNP
jgi:hypothetical protein